MADKIKYRECEIVVLPKGRGYEPSIHMPDSTGYGANWAYDTKKEAIQIGKNTVDSWWVAKEQRIKEIEAYKAKQREHKIAYACESFFKENETDKIVLYLANFFVEQFLRTKNYSPEQVKKSAELFSDIFDKDRSPAYAKIQEFILSS